MSKVAYRPHNAVRADRPDGTILLRSGYEMGTVAARTSDWLHAWAEKRPDAVFIAERSGAGWREETYAATLEKARAIGAALLERGLDATTPILIISGNGVDHALLTLGAQYVGVPTVPVAEQYALIQAAHGQLRHVIGMVRPRLVFAVDGERFGAALALEELSGIEAVTSRGGGGAPFDDLLRGGGDVDAARAAVGPDTVAKILMTSGSTSMPKGVLTTNRMMCANQTQIADAMPFLRDRPPRIVDWLPWNHVFGGSHNFNMMLANGGSLYIDDGKPVKGLVERSIENLSMIGGTAAFNVPVGFGMLVEAMRADEALRRKYFADLDLVVYAGASLPQDVWRGLEDMAREVRGTAPLITSSWGLTETAPACLVQHEPTTMSGIVGVPMTGVTVKLIPDEDMRCEVRVKGPNVFQGYFEAPEKTAEAFDDEGFFITGDAMTFVDPADPNKGMRFDGRISEDFKLLTGTWVRAAQLRLDMLGALSPLAADLVVTGADRADIGLLIFPNADALARTGIAAEEDGGALVGGPLKVAVAERLKAASGGGSSMRVARALVLAEPPSMAEGEMTAKGNLNFRKVLTRRAALLERLYDDADPATVRV